MRVERQTFYYPEELAYSVQKKVRKAKEKGEPIDYLTFVADGEPTLDANLGREIELVKSLGLKIAVISNASLIWRDDVRRDLQKAHWVSLKVDAVDRKTWRRINKPHKLLNHEAILGGMLKFADAFDGTLATESMLIRGINDDSETIEGVANFLAKLRPDIAYLAIPIRPPTVATVTAASEQVINMAYQIFSERLSTVEYLIGYEGNAFASTGNARDDLLSITSVHPMREEAVAEFLKRTSTGWDSVEDMIKNRSLVELEYQGKKFYMRRLPALTLPRF